MQSLDLSIADPAALAERLRSRHRARGAPFDQALRGGSQTEGSLLTRAEPEIVDLRARITEAVADYIRRLPLRDERRPTMWHGTRPFRAGERLTVTFDGAPLT